MEVDVVSLAAEFPNDNPALHRGAVWVCLETVGAPVPERAELEPELEAEPERLAEVEPAAEPEPALERACRESGVVPACHDEDDEPIVVEDLEPLDAPPSVEGATLVLEAAEFFEAEREPEPEPDGFLALVAAMADVAKSAGSPELASAVSRLLLEGRSAPDLPVAAQRALAEGGVAEEGRVTPAFADRARAWRAILSGASDDLGACGDAMLDEWASDLLARMLGDPSRASTLRRELRARGVAAFGLALAA